MSLADQMLADGFKTHTLGVQGNPFRIESGPNAGQTFMANDQVATALNTPFELGEDLREMIVLHCASAAPALDRNVRISGLGATWQVVRREDNPSDSTTDFWAQKIVPGKDA